ncbi:uncharacterized protein BXZ73DRAFT_93484 [Epithele typhae]|uniref:uncharacterized protein n=1 Tax=Epithele typhae TaxID=378194 RepID=UPI0020081B76|nr:uncharacterized protein BXZ73DRAFT_93484 [Epithele typhae]KAH9911153.1 hypothetical protein BXZ73DRAFT_93484 [Epithele typhae]
MVEEWLPLRDDFLDELLRFSGSEYLDGHNHVKCRICEEPATFRCADSCSSRRMYCKSCALARHADLPLHILEMWDGITFVKVDLRTLGAEVQLGHDGDPCPNPCQNTRRLVVVDIDGIHQVQVRFCECLDPNDTFALEWVQVFRQGWFPATTLKPATAATFRLLDFFQTGPLCQTLANLVASSAQPRSRSSRYNGHSPGELAVECPACPHPGKNLPDDWASAPDDVK